MGNYFEKLHDLLQKYQISAKNIFNADEVGVQLSDLGLKFISTRNCICRNLTNDHVTVMITSSAVGSLLPPYLLFPGKDQSVVPNVIQERCQEVWGTFSDAGWMDVERFQVYTMKLLDELRARSGITDLSQPLNEYHLLLVDGHNSHLDATTLFNCASKRLIIFCGPSNLTNAWQANDAGVNKAFKENLSKIVAPHIEAHLGFTSSDVTTYILVALKEENMKKSIKHSFRHVGIEPFHCD